MQTFEYRLYPNRKQKQQLMSCLIECRELYNEMLQTTIDRYNKEQKFYFRYDLNKMFAGRSVNAPASTVQCLADRLDKALRAYLDRKKKDPKAGFPRFKKPNQFHSFQLRQLNANFYIKGTHLRIPKKIGRSIKIKLYRPLLGMPKTCYMALRADNHWYALIVCDVSKVEPEKIDKKSIGIDVGLKTFLTDSEGNTVANPTYYKYSQKQLRIKQRSICRRKKGSSRRRDACRSAAKTHLRVVRQRRDFHFKVAGKYASKFGLIAVEKLNIGGMVKNEHLSKAIMDVGWGQFISILKFKAENAGSRVVEVNPAYTSQRCFKCKEIVQKSLSVRTHVCPHCGYVADRDVNAAKNILAKALAIEKQAGAQPSDVKPSVGKVSLRIPCAS